MSPEGTQSPQVFDARDLRPVRHWLTQVPAGLDVTADLTDDALETHYDTSDWRFHRAGLSIRIRSVGDERVALALPADDSPLAPAGEEVPVDAAGALEACPGPVGERVRALAQPLERRFELRSRRERFLVSRDDDAFAAVVLDEITIPLREQGEPVRLNRVEVTGTGVDDGALAAWVDTLRASFGLQPALPSRDTAALLALGLQPPPLPDLGSTAVSADLSVGETAFAALRQQFAKCLANDPGTRLGEDIERLHDMRVATRRMRAAFRLYEDFLPRRVLTLRKDLSWLGGALGEVRDLDVQLAQLETWRGELASPDRPALDALVTIVGRQRSAARRRMLRALGSRRFDRFVERMIAALVRGPATTSRSARTPILAIAPDLIAGRFKRVERQGRKIGEDSPTERYHQLRIRCKALRYALEFHRPLYGAKAEKLIRRLVVLQDLLGDHQDATVAVTGLRTLVERHGRRLPPNTLFVVGVLAERYDRRAADLRAEYPRAFERMRGRRWKGLAHAMNASRPQPAAAPKAPEPAPLPTPPAGAEDGAT